MVVTNKMTRFPVLDVFSCFRTSFSCFLFFLGKWFCPGTSLDRGVRPGIFAPALVPGKGTTGQWIIFVPGQRDNGTSRPVETLICTYFMAFLHFCFSETIQGLHTKMYERQKTASKNLCFYDWPNFLKCFEPKGKKQKAWEEQPFRPFLYKM